MNILVISQNFFPENFRINDLLFNLKNKKISFKVLTGKPNYPDGKLYNGFNLFNVQKKRIKNCDIVYLPIILRSKNPIILSLNYFSFIFSATIYITFMRKRFDRVFVYAPSPIIQAICAIYYKFLRKDTKIYLWIQDLWPDAIKETNNVKNKYIIKSLRALVNWIYKKFDVLITQSDFSLKDNIIKKFKKKTEVLMNPPEIYEKSIFAYKPFFSRLSKSNFNLVYAGNLGKSQSIETLVKTAKIMKNNNNIIFHIFGNGNQLTYLKQQKKNFLLNNLIVYGKVSKKFMPRIYKNSSAFLITLRNTPSFSKIIPSRFQTFLSFGKPIICSANGQLRDIILKSKCGKVSEAGNYRKLCKNILYLSKLNKKNYQKICNSSLRIYNKKFHINEIQKKFYDIIDLSR